MTIGRLVVDLTINCKIEFNRYVRRLIAGRSRVPSQRVSCENVMESLFSWCIFEKDLSTLPTIESHSSWLVNTHHNQFCIQKYTTRHMEAGRRPVRARQSVSGGGRGMSAVYGHTVCWLTCAQARAGPLAAGGAGAGSVRSRSVGGSRWPFARPVSRGLARASPEPGAPARAPPSRAQRALQMLPPSACRPFAETSRIRRNTWRQFAFYFLNIPLLQVAGAKLKSAIADFFIEYTLWFSDCRV